MNINQKLGERAGEDFKALAGKKGLTVEELEAEAVRWYLKKAQEKLSDSRPRTRLKRLNSK
ncbi:hypothetical protein ACTXGL_01525 [Psychrobacter sp. T6-6]|uniref:hypothetical protein n=1 Tax=Psychrobacter sp. T6-6 TaxID=3457452 RepID=UPI003FD325D9